MPRDKMMTPKRAGEKSWATGSHTNTRFHVSSGAAPDFTIRTATCGDFDVHLDIVCAQSPVFKAMCNGNYIEAIEGIVDLSTQDDHTLARMLRFMYTGDYNDGNPRNVRPYHKMINAAQIYALADVYDIPALKTLAVAKFLFFARCGWPCDSLGCLPIVQLVYETTPASDKGLRNIVVEACARGVGGLLRDPRWRDLMRRQEDFEESMLDAAAERMGRDENVVEQLTQRLRNIGATLETAREGLGGWEALIDGGRD